MNELDNDNVSINTSSEIPTPVIQRDLTLLNAYQTKQLLKLAQKLADVTATLRELHPEFEKILDKVRKTREAPQIGNVEAGMESLEILIDQGEGIEDHRTETGHKALLLTDPIVLGQDSHFLCR